MTTNQMLNITNEPNWRIGFSNMLSLENSRWWHTRRWWTTLLGWIFVMNLLTALSVFSQVDRSQRVINSGLELYLLFLHIFTSIGVAISMQGAIVSEKQSGTAAWILSKPVSRTAFILSRAFGTWQAAMVLMIAAQGAVTYFLLSLMGGYYLTIIPFIVGLVFASLHLTFYLTLTIFLGTVFESRGPIIGSAMTILLGQQALGGLIEQIAPWVMDILPGKLGTDAGSIATGVTLLSEINIAPIIATVLWSVFFLGMAVRRFQSQEF
ncbi:MAG: ABC transporter permease [Proteobacteria bacterium]|nr:ABC transporter permease [Pseudomonadota bacterium]